MIRAFDLLIQSLIIYGLRPRLQRLDNEAYLAFINYLTKQGIDYQLAPLHINWRSNAECVIHTFKKHFIAGLCSVDPNFPLNVNTSGRAGAQIPPPPLGDSSTPLGEIMQNVCTRTRSTRLSVTSHSKPLINAKHQSQVTNYL
jgi:hypothetical protein